MGVGDQAHFVEALGVEGDLVDVMGIGFLDAQFLDLLAAEVGHELAFEGDPEIAGEFGVAADAVGMAGDGPVGSVDWDGQFQLAGGAKDGMFGFPAAAVEGLDDEDFGHVAQGHDVEGGFVRGVGFGGALGGVGEAADALAAGGGAEGGGLVLADFGGGGDLPGLGSI